MAITLNAASKTRSFSSTSHTSMSFAVDAGTGSNRLLVVLIIDRNGTPAISGVTYNSAALTQAATLAHSTASPTLRVSIYYLIAPATGSNTLAVSYAAAVIQTEVMAFVLEGVDQTAPLDDTDSAEGSSTTPAVSLIPTTDNQALVAAVVHETANALTVDAGETSLYDTDEGAWVVSGSYAIQTTAATQSMNWTAGTSDLWVAAGASFKAASAGGNTSVTPTAASCVAKTTAPAAILGALTLTPVAASCVAKTTAPAVLLGNVSVIPAMAAAIARAVAPVVNFGSMAIIPAIASVVARVANPQVDDGAQVERRVTLWGRIPLRKRVR